MEDPVKDSVEDSMEDFIEDSMEDFRGLSSPRAGGGRLTFSDPGFGRIDCFNPNVFRQFRPPGAIGSRDRQIWIHCPSWV